MNIRSQLQESYGHYLQAAERSVLTSANELNFVKASSDSTFKNSRHSLNAVALHSRAEATVVPYYSLQNVLRPLYGKGEAKRPDIGDHPDFRHLKGTCEEEQCAITTLFIDIEGSTRLSLRYSLSDVRKIKNAFICAAIEIIQAFDGHVHRIMGDAVMAYFGGKSADDRASAIDVVNCASALRYFVDVVVIPSLKKEGLEDPFGIRIGADYGKKENVLWSSYGYPGVEEVTATSYFVDIAAKLQQSAGRNQIMLGSSLRELLDFPLDLLRTKTVIVDGKEVEKPYVEPNYNVDQNGGKINYRQYILDWQRFLLYTPIAQNDPNMTSKMQVTADVFDSNLTQTSYCACSLALPKERIIRFNVKLPYVPKLPYTLVYRVENHGDEARNAGGNDFGNHETSVSVTTLAQHQDLTHYEATAYRGLHYLSVEALAPWLSMKTNFGVFIE